MEPPIRTHRGSWRTPIWLICMLGAFVATHVPAAKISLHRLPNDLLLHFVGFVLLGVVTIWRAAGGGARIGLRLGLLWCLLLVAYGLFDERTQPFVGRSFQWVDWLADSSGAAAGVMLTVCGYRWISRRAR